MVRDRERAGERERDREERVSEREEKYVFEMGGKAK